MHFRRSNDGSYSLQVAWAEPDGEPGQLTLYIDSKDAWQLPELNTEPSEMHTVNAILAFTSGKAAGSGPRLCVALLPGSTIRTGEHVVCAVGPGATCVLPFVVVCIIECSRMVSTGACMLIEQATKPPGAALQRACRPASASTLSNSASSRSQSPSVKRSEPKKSVEYLVISDFETRLSEWGEQPLIYYEVIMRIENKLKASFTQLLLRSKRHEHLELF